MTAKLELGTVQWGLPYGIANRSGRPGIEEVRRILSLGAAGGILTIDTAHSYGEAEEVLGCLGVPSNGYQVYTKTIPVQADRISDGTVETLAAAFDLSLRRLRTDRVAGLLVHHAPDLLVPGAERLWEWMSELRSTGRAKRIGASVYHPAELLRILDVFPLDAVQFPYNIYDQRFGREGLIRTLKNRGIETHARSPFLQGLLLLPPEELPAHFEPIRQHQARLHRRLAEENRTPVDAALTFAMAEPDIDYVIVGCETAEQMEGSLAIIDQHSRPPEGLHEFALDDEAITIPSSWQW